MSNGARLDSSAAPLPANYECLGCLYDMGGAEARVCPECGRDASTDAEAFAGREHARHQVFGMLVMHAVVGGAICALFSLGAGLLVEEPWSGLDALGACGAAVCGSTFLGLIASVFARKRERAAFFVVWLRTQFWLNASWLCAPVCGLVVLGAYFERLGPRASTSGLPFVIALVGFLVWLLATFVCVVRWIVVFRRGVRRLHLRGALPKLAFAAAAIVVVLGSMGLGFGAGVMCLGAAERIVHPR